MAKTHRVEIEIPCLSEIRYIIYSQLPNLLIVNVLAPAQTLVRFLRVQSRFSLEELDWLLEKSAQQCATGSADRQVMQP